MRTVFLPAVIIILVISVFAKSKPSDGGLQAPTVQTSREGTVRRPVPNLRNHAPTGTNLEFPPHTPVVTLEGVCAPELKGAEKRKCKTVITRAQMDSLMDALGPDPAPAARRQFAINYARLLAASTLAQRQHLEKDPAVLKQLQAQLNMVRMQVLANTFYHQVEEHAADIPMSEIQKYYAEHQVNFDQGTVRRLSVPISAPTASGQVLEASTVKAKAEELRARAVAGEDYEQLQQVAYQDLGIKSVLPPTKLNMVRRTSLPPDEAGVFDLKPGEVTQVLNSRGTVAILKLESKHSLPIEAVKDEIRSVLQRVRIQQQLANATKGVKAEFNLKYLDMGAPPELFPAPVPAQESRSSWTRSSLRQYAAPRRGMPPARQRISILPKPGR